jgi:hypothetical protein
VKKSFSKVKNAYSPKDGCDRLFLPIEVYRRTNMLADEICQDCGRPISRRAKANVWNGERIVCTPCLKKRESAVQRADNIMGMIGKAGSPWVVHDGRQQAGPYTTAEMIKMLRKNKIDWLSKIFREGMKDWKPAGQLFTNPAFNDGKIELRDFGQGDGTYRPESVMTHHPEFFKMHRRHHITEPKMFRFKR